MKANTYNGAATMALLFLLFCCIGSVQAQDRKCSDQRLAPHLYADICLPPAAAIQAAPQRIVCDDYHLVGVEIGFQGGTMEIHELPKCEKGSLRTAYINAEEQTMVEGVDLHSKSERTIVLSHADGTWEIHGFRSPSGWPYHITAHTKGSEEDMRFIKKCVESLDFDLPDSDF